MFEQTAVALGRQMLETTLCLVAPILIVAIIVGLVVSIVQVMTSIQDTTISTVPRLAAVGLTTFFLMPWLVRRLVVYTAQLLSDFRPYVG
jgi:flagellar biosynthesis protein FliQ